jgi:Domain of unknown function (DUF4260)
MTAPTPSPAVRLLLRLEQATLAAAGLAIFLVAGGPWWLFPLLLLLPDVSMVGYLAGPRVGAIAYNAVHNLVLAGAVLGIGWWADAGWPVLVGAILLAHVGVDRTSGYGLKLPTDFKDTHLGRIGRS